MPIVRPPRDLSKVKSVKKYKTRNGEVVHELVVLFDYVGLFLEDIFWVWYDRPEIYSLISSERGRYILKYMFGINLKKYITRKRHKIYIWYNQREAGLSESVLQGLKEIFLKFDTDKASEQDAAKEFQLERKFEN